MKAHPPHHESRHFLERLAHAANALLHDSHPKHQNLAMFELRSLRRMEVTSPSFERGMPIPDRHAGVHGVSPALSFAGVPVETKQLALICEDPDAPGDAPFVHWTAYSIEPITKHVAEGVAPGPVGSGFKQGRNSAGTDGYAGPRPPAGDSLHHYHFQLFALDTTVSLAAGADRDSLVRALRTHVLAAGDLVGTYRSRLTRSPT